MAAETFHSPTPEEIMEYVDGEGTPAARANIQAHLATCPACQALAAEQRGLSRDLNAWQVAPAPDSLRAPESAAPSVARPWWRPAPYVMAGLSVAAVIFVMVSYQARRSQSVFISEATDSLLHARARGAQAQQPAVDSVAAGGQPPASFVASDSNRSFDSTRSSSSSYALATPASAPQQATATIAHGPAVIRTATLQLVAKDFTHARSAVEVILDGAGGFADQLGLAADPGTARVLRGTLRVPGTRLTDVLTRLRALGLVTQDQQNTQDVADQLVDMDARLKSARATEERLIGLLKNRTGKLSDVLEVEQELTRVRLEIERLDAEKTNMSRRVAYATIDLTISEERKAGLEPGPLPLLMQIRLAAADGLQNVVDTLVGISLFALRAGPSLVLWALVAVSVWIAVKRYRRSVRSTVSG